MSRRSNQTSKRLWNNSGDLMRKPVILAIVAAAFAAAPGCASGPPAPPPPWLTPDRISPKPVEAGSEQLQAADAGSGETQTVEAEGEGVTAEAAKKDALRNAVERGAGIVVRNQSLVVDWHLARDIVLTETRGSIVKFDLLSLQRTRGVFRAKVRATVCTKMIAKDLSILHYLSNHARIACVVADFAGGAAAETALARSGLQNALLDKKFNLVDRSQVEAINARERLDSFDHPAVARELGRRWGCDILITGKACANFAKVEQVYGVKQFFYTASIEARAVLVSTGKVIASENVTVRRGGRSRASAQKLAISGAGSQIASPLIKKIVLHLRKSSLDQQSIQILIMDVTFERLMRLEGQLKKVNGMERVVQRSYQHGAATLDCTFKGDSRTLAVVLGKIEEPRLEILGVERNRIEVKVK